MVKENLAAAKAHLSRLVSSALAGEEVLICKDNVPVVRLVPVCRVSGEDPCRPLPQLTVEIGDAARVPLAKQDWGDLA